MTLTKVKADSDSFPAFFIVNETNAWIKSGDTAVVKYDLSYVTQATANFFVNANIPNIIKVVVIYRYNFSLIFIVVTLQDLLTYM